jgi:hypothetical protein
VEQADRDALEGGRSVSDPVPVPRAGLDGIEAVRRSERVNMLDRPAVVRIADQLGFHEAVLWIHEHPGEYARGVFAGFRVVRAVGDLDG